MSQQTKFLPGDPQPDKIIQQMLRVNQAGEYGAERIYSGQLFCLELKSAPAAEIELIQNMYNQELVHLAYFNQAIPRFRTRPTLLQPLWYLGGWALGFITALRGNAAGMVCTEAVETVIDQHYSTQLEYLANTTMPQDLNSFATELKQKIELFRAEEIEHKNIAIQNGGSENNQFRLLNWVIMGITKIAIAIAKKI